MLILDDAAQARLRICTAESCTGGLLAGLLTDIPGRANISVAITGVAGPGGGTPMKPVGTVHVACARENRAVIHEMLQVGDIGREQIRLAAMECALKQIQMQIA